MSRENVRQSPSVARISANFSHERQSDAAEGDVTYRTSGTRLTAPRRLFWDACSGTPADSRCATQAVDRRLYRSRDESVCAEHGQQLRGSAAAHGGGTHRLSRRPVGDGPVAGRGAHGSDTAQRIARNGVFPGRRSASSDRIRRQAASCRLVAPDATTTARDPSAADSSADRVRRDQPFDDGGRVVGRRHRTELVADAPGAGSE